MDGVCCDMKKIMETVKDTIGSYDLEAVKTFVQDRYIFLKLQY